MTENPAVRFSARSPWHSLRWRLPALLMLLIISLLGIVVYAAYREMHAGLDRMQGDRARRAAAQIGTLLTESSRQSTQQLQAAVPVVRAWLQQPTPGAAAAAREALDGLGPGPTRLISVWAPGGELVLELPPRGAAGTDMLPRPSRPVAPAGVGPLQQTPEGRTYSEISVDMGGAAPDATAGSITLRTLLALTPPDALTRLVGRDADIGFANRTGEFWTDLAGPVTGPAIDHLVEGLHEYRLPDGDTRIGALSHLAGTPWMVWVGFPDEANRAAASVFLRSVIGFVIFVAAVGVAIVGWFCTRLTRPLARMTAAAEAISDGDYSRRVSWDRNDEIGRLSVAFNAMAARIDGARHELEQRVESRTRELNAALAALSRDAHEREAYLATIVDSSADAILSHDRAGVITSWNKSAERMFGYTAEESIGSSTSVFIPPEHLAEDARIVHTVFSGDSVPAFETVRRTKSGRLIEVSITASPIVDAAGRVVGVSKMVRDIALQKQAEREVRAQRDRAQQYLDTAQVILAGVDLQGRVELMNRYGCDVLGRPPEAVIGHHYSEFVPPSPGRPPQGRLREVVAGELLISESLLLTASGDERMIEWRHATRTDSDGRVIGTLSSGTDITDRNRAIEALRVAEERMRFALEGANVGIWDIDYTTGTLQLSETLEAQFGLAPGAFPGTVEAFINLIHPDDRDAATAAFVTAIKGGGDFALQHRAVWPDGTVRWLRGAGRVVRGEDGKATRGIGISLDVTEQRNLEAQFQQAQKMDAVGRLAGGIAHDFNNLLTAILGYCELLLEDPAVDTATRRALTEIQKAGTRAAGLTRQLLAFSRKQIIQPTLLDLNVVVEDMRPMLERLIGEDIVTSFKPARVPALVLADRGQIEQVIMNLAVNARDAMPTGGALLIEVAAVELDEHYAAVHLAAKPGAYFALIVTDTGSGMTPEVQAHLFEPFFTTKEQGKGTGLGLATVHGIVARFGGSIGVYSELGKGTSFKIYLPAHTEAAREPEPPAVAPPAPERTAHATVLVVDDAEGLRELSRRILERRGYQVLVAANADEALALFDQHREIDVLLTDVVMPGTSGPDLTRALMAKRPALRVIFMSGYTDDAISHHGVLTAGTSFLDKPFTASALANKVAEILKG